VVDGANLAHVRLEDAALGNVVGDHLIEGAGVQVGALLALHEPPDDFRRRDNPPDAQARRQGFGEGAEVDRAFRRECGDGDDVLALETQRAVGIVLDDDEVVFACQLDQAQAAFFGEGGAGGIVEVGQHVDEAGGFLLQQFRQLVYDHAVVIEEHRQEARLVGLPGLDGAEIGRALGDDRRVGVYEDFADQIQGLL